MEMKDSKIIYDRELTKQDKRKPLGRFLPKGVKGARTRGLISTPDGEELHFAIAFEFRVSNNEAKYEAWLRGMKML